MEKAVTGSTKGMTSPPVVLSKHAGAQFYTRVQLFLTYSLLCLSCTQMCRRKSRHQDDGGSHDEARSSRKKKKAKDKGRRRSTKD